MCFADEGVIGVEKYKNSYEARLKLKNANVSTMRRKGNLHPFLFLQLFFHVLCVPRRTPRQLRMQSRLLNKRPSPKIPELDND